MALQTTVQVGATATQLTNADVTAITFQNVGAHPVYVRATNGATPPSTAGLAGWLRYEPGFGERNVALTDLFPGIASANRVWAVARTAITQVAVSHA